MSTSYTNVFEKYFATSGIQYTDANVTCESAANSGKDLSFDINGSSGQITDSKNVVSSIDLSDVHYDLSEYGSQTKIIQPHTSYLLAGNDNGLAYASQFFKVCYAVENSSDWQDYVNIQFNLSRICNFRQTTTRFETYKEDEDASSFLVTAQALLNGENLPVTIAVESLKDHRGETHQFITFRSNTLGFEYLVSDVRLIPLYQDINFPNSPFITDEVTFSDDGTDASADDISDFFPDASVDCKIANQIVNSIVNHVDLDDAFKTKWAALIEFMKGYTPQVHKLIEYLTWRIYAQKYPNGAMGGLILKIVYPDNVDTSAYALKINHIKDHISKYNMVTLAEDASLIKDVSADDFDDWHTPTVQNKILFQKYNYTVRASYVNPEESDCHDWMDGGIYVHKETSDNAYDDGWVPGTRATSVNRYNDQNWCRRRCAKDFVTNKIDPSLYDPSIWENDTQVAFENDMIYWADGHVDSQDFIGMYGYLNYVNQYHNWTNVGTFYSIFGFTDTVSNNIKNLVPSAFIFNPNDFPVKITYMMFS